MARTPFDQMQCPIARTVDVIGEWWTPLILRDIAIGVRRFDAIQRDLGVSRKVLSQRLAALVEHGIVEQTPYQLHPPRHDYVLTAKGADLALVLLAMQSWGERWIFGKDATPVLLRHEVCGQPTELVPACAACGEPLRAGEVTPVPGPGLAGADAASGHEVTVALERLAVAQGQRDSG